VFNWFKRDKASSVRSAGLPSSWPLNSGHYPWDQNVLATYPCCQRREGCPLVPFPTFLQN
jgi:hypothetical protein